MRGALLTAEEQPSALRFRLPCSLVPILYTDWVPREALNGGRGLGRESNRESSTVFGAASVIAEYQVVAIFESEKQC